MVINNEIITFTKDELNKIYNESSEEKRKALKELFSEEIFKFDYHDIKTYADACKKLGMKEHLLTGSLEGDREAYSQAQALYKLLIIQKAMNNGVWCDKNGWSYYPYWVFYSKEEMERMSEEEKQRSGIKHLLFCTYIGSKEKQRSDTKQLLSCTFGNSNESVGFRCATANRRGADTTTYYGFPLCFNSKEAALYAANQFESLFFDYYGIKVEK